ncbi:hypothetical protein [Nostoc sp.]
MTKGLGFQAMLLKLTRALAAIAYGGRVRHRTKFIHNARYLKSRF